jgi:hypothetical protein
LPDSASGAFSWTTVDDEVEDLDTRSLGGDQSLRMAAAIGLFDVWVTGISAFRVSQYIRRLF